MQSKPDTLYIVLNKSMHVLECVHRMYGVWGSEHQHFPVFSQSTAVNRTYMKMACLWRYPNCCCPSAHYAIHIRQYTGRRCVSIYQSIYLSVHLSIRPSSYTSIQPSSSHPPSILSQEMSICSYQVLEVGCAQAMLKPCSSYNKHLYIAGYSQTP